MSDCYQTDKQPIKFADSYKLIENIPKFHKYRNKGFVFDHIYTIEDNIKRTSGILITGNEKCGDKYNKSLKLGDSYYFKNGKCGKRSHPKCIAKDRHIIVDNLPNDIKNNEGLIPSIIGDITDDLNPGNLMMNILGKGKDINDNCSLKKITFKQHYPKSNFTAKKTKYLCVPDDSYIPIQNENFSNFNTTYSPKNKKYKKDKQFLFILFIFFSLLLCFFVF